MAKGGFCVWTPISRVTLVLMIDSNQPSLSKFQGEPLRGLAVPKGQIECLDFEKIKPFTNCVLLDSAYPICQLQALGFIFLFLILCYQVFILIKIIQTLTSGDVNYTINLEVAYVLHIGA